jgi:hypothetical protein
MLGMRLTPVRIRWLAAVLWPLACTTEPTTPWEVVGVRFQAAISDSALARLRQLGDLVAVVRLARTAVLRTRAGYDQLSAIPGVAYVGPSLGTDPDSVSLEVLLAFPAAVSSADSAWLRGLGVLEPSTIGDSLIYVIVAAANLGQLDRPGRLVSVWIVIDPMRLMVRMHRRSPPNTRLQRAGAWARGAVRLDS